jgi:hypothetical protein
MFSKSFPQMLADTAQGNPSVVAHSITWSAGLIAHHLVAVNAAFATVQVALGLGMAFRPAVKIALAASVAWAFGVWWFGEGLGAVLTGNASPVNGAPGAVIIYALLAVLLWPADRDLAAPFVAGRAVGRRVAQGLWLVLWTTLMLFAVMPATRAPRAISSMISSMASGQPGWLAWIDDHAALARATYRTIRRNLAWAFGYNLLALPLAAAGFLNPLVAAAAMTLSSVFVVWNSLRLRRFALPEQGRLHGGVVLGLHPFPDPPGGAGQLVQAGQHGLVIGPRPGEYLGIGRRHLDLGGLQVTQQGDEGALLVTAKIAHIPNVSGRARPV